MSYCRWSSEGSDVYVYVALDRSQLPIGCEMLVCMHPDDSEFRTHSYNAMMDHLRGHEAIGVRVPARVYDALRDEQKEFGDDLRRKGWKNRRRKQ
jgi:hypothetical protein